MYKGLSTTVSILLLTLIAVGSYLTVNMINEKVLTNLQEETERGA